MYVALIFEHTPNLNAFSLLTCCFSFRLLLNILCKQQMILCKQVFELKQRLLHVWHALTRPSLTMSGMDAFCLHADKSNYSSNYYDNIQTYAKCHTIFRLFFVNYHKFELLTFTRQCSKILTEGMVGSIICVFLQIYFSFQHWKNFENPLRIDKDIAMSLVYYCLGTSCICF